VTNGIIYIAFGRRYVDEAIFSAATVRSFAPISTTIFTDIDVKDGCFDTVVKISPEHKRAKVDFLSQSPYDRTLYLDSDTRIMFDISEMFDVLDKFDFAACHDLARKSYHWGKKIPDYDAIPYAFPEYNGGVLLYKKSPRMDAFLESWRHYFYKNRELTNGKDQASFRIALWNSDLSIHSLPFEYNVRPDYFRKRIRKRARQPGEEGLMRPRILHWHDQHKWNPFKIFSSRYRPMKKWR
jgi:lipopolysaccharide biosynthesis glycosyltransferase